MVRLLLDEAENNKDWFCFLNSADWSALVSQKATSVFADGCTVATVSGFGGGTVAEMFCFFEQDASKLTTDKNVTILKFFMHFTLDEKDYHF
jgi:hypothetical protein